jgi:hypothetical protein
MARLYLFGEGLTEVTFADLLLKPHLANHGVYLAHAIDLGGGRNDVPWRNDIRRLLAQEKGADVFFTTMIDLYRIPVSFPRHFEAEKLRNDPTCRVKFLEQAFADDIADPRSRFVPHIQLHEYEAILFCDSSCFRYHYDRHEKQIAALQKIADSYATPELIDDGPQTGPSKQIEAQFPDYVKPAMGADLAVLIGLEAIRTKCPHFNAWLSRLEQPET